MPTSPDAPSPALRLAGLGVLAIGLMLPVTLPVAVLRELVEERFGVSELLTSLFMSVNMAGALVTAPLAGALVDRVGRARSVLVGAIALDAACFFALAAPVPFAAFMAIRFLEGCAHIAALSVVLTLASRALPEGRRGRSMGVVGGAMTLGIALGAPLGGVLGGHDPLLPLRVGGVLLLLALPLAALTACDGGAIARRPRLGAIVRTLGAHRALAIPLAFAFADRFTVGFFTTTLSLYTRRIHELDPAGTGAAIACFMLPFALLSYPFGRLAERVSVAGLLCVGSVLYGLGTAVVGFVAPPGLFALMAALGVAAAVMFVPSMLLTTQLVPEELRATAMGAFNAAGSLGFIVGPAVGGAVSEWVAAGAGWESGYRAAFLVAGASELACVALALPALRRLRRRGGTG